MPGVYLHFPINPSLAPMVSQPRKEAGEIQFGYAAPFDLMPGLNSFSMFCPPIVSDV